MTKVNMSLIKELRERTNAGMLDCKNALAETENDIEQAIDWLRKNGHVKATKKQGRIAAEGLIAYSIRSEGSAQTASLIEVNSETDFVARNELFQNFVLESVDKLTEDKITDIEVLKETPLKSGQTVAETVIGLVSTIGENITLRRLQNLSVTSGVISGYIHNSVIERAGQIGVIIALESNAQSSVLEALGHDLALHIAAHSPLAVSEAELDQAVLEREKEIYTQQAKESGRDDAIIEKMVQGRLKKFIADSVLEKQKHLMNPDMTVDAVMKDIEKQSGHSVTLKGFYRFQLGEGIEKQEVNFADEVASMTQS